MVQYSVLSLKSREIGIFNLRFKPFSELIFQQKLDTFYINRIKICKNLKENIIAKQ